MKKLLTMILHRPLEAGMPGKQDQRKLINAKQEAITVNMRKDLLAREIQATLQRLAQ